MHLFGGLRAVPWWVAGGLGAVLWTGLAQASGPAQEADWRRANEAVGALARGHADVLKWEQEQAPAPGQTAAPQPALVGEVHDFVMADARKLAQVGEQIQHDITPPD